ncbi:MAG: type II toxin-antitoxin system RelE/ParE family toxin [Candidatus Levybacteria bacterium]|nr:type II toxin-antitoxin system RelE/ParE family toxin [Candidatus Levybacteria bacterium]
MFRIRTSSETERELKKLKKIYELRIKQAIEDIKENPLIGKSLSRELTGRYSHRIGDYRIIYTVSFKEKIVNIISVKHRSIAYQ